MSRTSITCCALAFVSLIACDQTFTPVSLVDNLRVLGARAEPPELRPGETAQITALIADPKGMGRAVTVAWGRCDPGIVTDLLACQRPERVTPIGLGESIAVTVPADYLSNAPGGPKQKRLFLLAGAARAEGEQRIFFKEIVVRSDAEPLNKNPVLTAAALYPRDARQEDGGVVVDGGAAAAPLLTITPGGEATLVATVDPASAERYTESMVTKTEDRQLSFFATAGEIALVRTVDHYEDNWKAPATTTPGLSPVTFWVVLRDGRNGTDWKSFTVEVR